jgi:hypothetical protein
LSSAHINPLALCSTNRLLPTELIGDELLAVHLQIAVGVAHEPQVRGLADEDAAIEDFQRSREHQSLGEHGPLVHLPVELPARLDVGHVAGHLDSPQAAVSVPIDDHRVLDHRFAGDELNVVAGR